jgi:hypothetical protein
VVHPFFDRLEHLTKQSQSMLSMIPADALKGRTVV